MAEKCARAALDDAVLVVRVAAGVVMEMAVGGELFDRITELENFSEEQARTGTDNLCQ